MRILWRLSQYGLRQWRLSVTTLVVTLAAAAAELTIPRFLQGVIDTGIVSRDLGLIAILAGLVVVVTALRGMFQFARMFLAEVLSQRVTFALRNAIYDHVQHLSFTFHDRTRTGELMARATSDVERVRRFASMGVFQMTQILVLTAGIAVMLILTNWQLALVSLVVVPVLVAIAISFSRRIQPMHRAVQEAWAELNVVLQENLAGSRVVRAFAQEDAQVRKFQPANDKLTSRTVLQMRLFAMRQPMFVVVLGLGQVAVLWYGGSKVISNELTLGGLVAFNAYLLLLASPVRMLGMTINSFARAIASGERIFQILDETSEVTERPNAMRVSEPRGEVTFDAASFEYGGQRVLHEISFHVKAGESIGIVGGTGSGKSTIINLLPRFYDPTAGGVLFDGYDLRELRIKWLRQQIGIVHQEPFIFATSIRENIAYGRPDATLDEVIGAAKAAQVHEFIETLPKQYETIVGERGVTLSGGQKQRIAIARALVLDPRVLILDESTSSVDTWTERAIQDALRRLMQGRTSVIISQRIRSVREAQEIIVLDAGHIVQRGAHEQLIAQDGLYREMYEVQEAEAERLRQETLELEAAPAVGGT